MDLLVISGWGWGDFWAEGEREDRRENVIFTMWISGRVGGDGFDALERVALEHGRGKVERRHCDGLLLVDVVDVARVRDVVRQQIDEILNAIVFMTTNKIVYSEIDDDDESEIENYEVVVKERIEIVEDLSVRDCLSFDVDIVDCKDYDELRKNEKSI